ncbi:hypothetical protein XarjCFBP7653_16015 [Xanthomonas arboricola]|nr:hypothetical protein XarjCFBP7653_16015 [Xanthomonas arboricola]
MVLDQHLRSGIDLGLQSPIPVGQVPAASICCVHRWALMPHIAACVKRRDDWCVQRVAGRALQPPVACAAGDRPPALLPMPYRRYVLRDVGNVPMPWFPTVRHTEQVRQRARRYDVRVACLASRKMDASPPP